MHKDITLTEAEAIFIVGGGPPIPPLGIPKGPGASIRYYRIKPSDEDYANQKCNKRIVGAFPAFVPPAEP